MSNFWDKQEEGEEYREGPKFVDGKWVEEDQADAPAPTGRVRQAAQAPQAPAAQEPSYEQVETADSDEEEDFTEVLSDARLRLESGRLWEMIMGHDLFENTDADERAVKNVQKEIRRFAKTQMEIMLGMRRETVKTERLEMDFPFNALEVEALKALAHTATKGATEQSDNYVPNVRRVSEEVPVVGQAPKSNKLNSISAKAPKPRPAPVQTKAPTKPLPTAPAAPIARKTLSPQAQQILQQEQIPVEALDLNYKPLEKDPSQMTEQELIERNKEISNRRRAKAKSPNAIPQPSFEQENMLAMQRVAEVGTTGIQTLVNIVNNQKK